jgi:hypothetical protein
VIETKETKPCYTAGFYDSNNHVVFEQVSGRMFAISPNAYTPRQTEPQLDVDYSIGENKYLPYFDLLPFPLVAKPLPYESTSALYQRIRTFIQKHFYVTDDRIYDVLASWVMATYLREKWHVVPYIFFYGSKATGKTRAMEVLHRLGYRGVLCGNTSTAALFRSVAEWKIILFLDEVEILNSENKSEIVALLNAGYRRGQVAIRVKHTEAGEILQTFDVFGFKCLSGTSGLRDTLESRCIFIRTTKNPCPIKFNINEKEASEIRAMLLKWRMDQLENFSEDSECGEGCEPLLEGVQDGRIQELFECLLQVANDGKESIISYAQDTAKEVMEENLTTLDAEILEALFDFNKDLLHLNEEKTESVFLTKDVANEINLERLEKDKLANRTVGKIIRRLGFHARHTKHGNGWLYDTKRLETLKAIYTPLKVPSQPSQGSPSSLNGQQKLSTEESITHD